MPIIAVLNVKGGAGKTTIVSNLGRAYQRAKKSVVYVDSDPQGSLRDWHAAGAANDLPPIVAMDKHTQFSAIERLADEYDVVLVDGCPSVKELAVAAITTADLVLIPIQPSPLDVWAADSLVSLIHTRQKIAKGAPLAYFVISRQIAGTKLASEIRDALNDYDLPILKGGTCQRVAYPTATAVGQTVLDTEPDGAAAAEIKAIAREVFK